MSLRFLVILTALSLLCQIIFGIYYSVAIVDQNTLINTRETDLDKLTIDHQQLEIRLSSLNSLTKVLEYTRGRVYSPVSSSINLN